MKASAITLVVAVAFAVAFAPARDVRAQSYPAKAVTLIVPFPPGGRTDLTARAIAEALKDELRQPVVVVNKPGASGVLGARKSPAHSPTATHWGSSPPAS